MRPCPVVLADRLAQGLFEILLSEDEHPVEAFAAHGPHSAFGGGIGPRGGHRSPGDPHTVRREDHIEGRRELAVAVTNQERSFHASLLEVPNEVARLLGHPGRGWPLGTPSQEDAACPQFEKEQDGQGLEAKRLDSEEVAGQDGPGLGAEEGSPRETAPAWGGWHTLFSQDGPNGGCADRITELEQFAPDALVPPARILPGKPEDLLAAVGRERWTPWATAPAESRPLAADQFPVPP